MTDLEILREQRDERFERMELISKRAGNRALTAVEQAEFDRLEGELRDFLSQIDKAVAKLDHGRKDAPVDPNESRNPDLVRQIRAGNNDLETYGTASDHRSGEVRMLGVSERLADKDYHLPDGLRPRELSFGRYVKGMIDGRFDGAPAEERLAQLTRAQGGSNAVLGGFLVPQVLSDSVIDLARNAAVVMKAGARTFEMVSEKVRLARLTADPSASWRTENSAISASTATFGAIDLRARSLACMVPISRELLQDASNASSVIENSIAASIGLAIDYAMLRGNGAAEQPTGIRYTTNVSLSTSTGGTTGFDPLARLVRDVYTNNYLGTPEALSLVYAPRTAATYMMLKDAQGQPLRQPDTLAAVQRFQSNQIPTNSTTYGGDSESEAYLGDFSQLVLAVRSPLEVQISNDYGFNTNQVYVRTIFRGDVAVLQPTWFSVLVGTTA